MTTPSPASYQTGDVRQDPATFAVAVRTSIIDPDNTKDWGIMTVDRGGHYASWDEVSTWVDMAQVPPPAQGA